MPAFKTVLMTAPKQLFEVS